ncbi:MAG: HEAT repeat domain-containing protein [Deltaproteobacteria bacterium]|nr:HEAT repeat domain-containing protein [Deltaproteobacteria bacterium]
MTQTILDFETELYQEHLEEASFLYEQRLTLFDDPEITWLDIADFEERFEAHIDALVVGEDLALNVCKTQAMEADFGELHAAVRVFCRQNRLDFVQECLETLDPKDTERVQAISDALNHELPAEWKDEFIRILSEGDQSLIPVAAKLIGYRRLSSGKELLQALQQNNSQAISNIIWSIGRVREQYASTLLFNKYLKHDDESICSATALALLRIGDPQTLDHCLRCAHSGNWPFLLLGLGGNRSTAAVLIESANNNKASADCLIALGLLGDISGVETLLSDLGNADIAESAAMALNLITGAGIYEEVFIPEEIDEDELFEEELEKLKRGESLYPPGEEPGTTITRISQKPEDWQKWWAENKSHFNPGIRYRNGKPYSPACLLENLESEKSSNKVRQLAYEELVIRYGIDFPFETDMLVSQQKQALAKYAEWIKINNGRFREGEWYFAGQLIHS